MRAASGCSRPACVCGNDERAGRLRAVPLAENAALHWATVLFAGAVTGSFLNVLVHRLPIMQRRRHLRDTGAEKEALPMGPGPYNLFWPRSHCPHCRATIPFRRNAPLLSWLWLRGVAPCCGARIPAHYFFLELLTVLVFCAAWLRFGADPQQTAALMAAFALLLGIAFLRREDASEAAGELLQWLLWGGLLAGALGWLGPLPEALWASAPCALAALVRGGLCSDRAQDWIDTQSLWLLAALGAWGGAEMVVFPLGMMLLLRLWHAVRTRLSALQLTAAAGVVWLLVWGVS